MVDVQQLGRDWAEDRWNRVYPWRHELPFIRPNRPGDETPYARLDAEEAERRAKSRGIPAHDAYKILLAAQSRWIELQGRGGHGRVR